MSPHTKSFQRPALRSTATSRSRSPNPIPRKGLRRSEYGSAARHVNVPSREPGCAGRHVDGVVPSAVQKQNDAFGHRKKVDRNLKCNNQMGRAIRFGKRACSAAFVKATSASEGSAIY